MSDTKAHRIVVIDTETSGLDKNTHEIIQFAAIAVERGREIDALELKLRFDHDKADAKALELNHYDPVVWVEEGVAKPLAVMKIAEFFRRHATEELMSKAGRPYTVAMLAGYNVGFDVDFTRALFENAFFPASYYAMDILSLAIMALHAQPDRPKNFKLQTVAAWLGVQGSEAHDALADARTAWRVAAALFPNQEAEASPEPPEVPARERMTEAQIRRVRPWKLSY